MLLYFDDDQVMARRLGRRAGLPVARIRRHRFPDGELKLTLPPRLPRRVTLLRSLHQPNEKLVELLLAAGTARELGAGHLTLVAPYLAYMRQDAAFGPGEAVSQRQVGALLAMLFDGVITVDPHLHRVASLAEVIPSTRCVTLSAAPLLGRFVGRKAPDALLIGPDVESTQWVRRAARAAGLEWAVAEKLRHGDRQVAVRLPQRPVRGRHVVLVDDLVSTGRTLAGAARQLRQAGARGVDVAATHALFTDDALQVLAAAGVGEVWTTDTVGHATNAVAVAPLLAAALAGPRGRAALNLRRQRPMS